MIGTVLITTAALIAALFVGLAVVGGKKKSTAGPITIDLTGATTTGTQPFFASIATPPTPTVNTTPAPSTQPTVTGSATSPATTQPTGASTSAPVSIPKDKVFQFPKVPSTTGDSPGLYGGTLNQSACNAKQMIKYLRDNPIKAKAWIAVQNADPTLRWSGGKLTLNNLDEYVGSLTPLVLRYNTYLINHGFNDNKANPLPEFLLAGNAVLVDKYGVPRARCYCGNPLTQAKGNPQQVRYRGVPGTVFDPNKPTVVVPAASKKPIGTFQVVDLKTGKVFTRPSGTTGSTDKLSKKSLPLPPTPTPTPTPSASTAATGTAPATTATVSATVSSVPVLPGTIFNAGFGVVAPSGFDVRADAYFAPYKDVPTIEVAQTDVDSWRTPTDDSQAGFSISDLTKATVDPYDFWKRTGDSLASNRSCNEDLASSNVRWTGASGTWIAYSRELGDCSDTISGLPQKTELLVLRRQSDGATAAVLVRAPATQFAATRTQALNALSTYQRQ